MRNQNKQSEVVINTGLQQLLSDIRYLDTETFPTFESEYKEEIKGMKVIKVYNIVMNSKLSININ